MKKRLEITKGALLFSASVLALMLSGCDGPKDTAPVADATAVQSTPAETAVEKKDCDAPGVSCTPAERASGNGEGMGAGWHANGMEKGKEMRGNWMNAPATPDKK